MTNYVTLELDDYNRLRDIKENFHKRINEFEKHNKEYTTRWERIRSAGKGFALGTIITLLILATQTKGG